MKTAETVVLFGGTGFIGTHLAQYLLEQRAARRIVLADLAPPRIEAWTALLQEGLRAGLVEFIASDVRQPIRDARFSASADLIVNLAAIHREPGHEAAEYFETNLRGAENVCAYASAVRCQRMVFVSSIAPYGPSEERKDERSTPAPETPYGISKLSAEEIHREWQAAEPERRLLIFRPGVVFGAGEGGNVTRLARSLVKGYFAYMGNRQTRKAGGYVKELCRVIDFALEHQERAGEAVTLLNVGMNPPPTVEEYVDSIRRVAGIKRTPVSVPRRLLLGVSYPIDAVARALGIRQPVSPVRVRKLFRSTDIDPRGLRELGYTWQYSLDEAFADWKRDKPEDFAR
ncbi:MAG: NAD-dependent epimerase/dehydratase family protein [Acidobacteriota bacterium]|nr:NAD-dependent epimerase/dehydratase family protein [Acidobacteriota bacterium]